MKKRNYTFLFACFLTSIFGFGQTSNQAQQEAHSIAFKPFAKRQKVQKNKATLIWGAGSTVGAAIGEFSTAFNTAGSWTATSINDLSGSPGNAFWTRSTTGISQGAYWGTRTAINSTSQANGVALFDSDFMDNGGIPGNFGNGSSGAPHKGELVSPAIDLTGYTDSALAVSFHCYWRNFTVNELSVSLSVDGGVTYTSKSIIAVLPAGANIDNQGNVNLVFPNITAGVSNLSNCRLKFTFDGNYYFAMIDDVSISTASEFDLVIQKADPEGSTLASANETFQIGNNVYSLENQINPADLRFGANVKNFGYQNINTSDNASLNLIIQENLNGNWTTVYQSNTIIDTISVLDDGTAVFDTISNHSWLKVGDFRAIYYTNIAGESNRSNDTLVQTFSITENYLSKVDLDIQNRPYYDRPIFPGGTNFNKFEFGSYFSSPNGGSDRLKADSISYVYYNPTAYNGSGSQVVNAYIYEWIDGGGTGTLDGLPDPLTAGEHTLVASGSETLSGLVAGGGYGYSSISFTDVNTNQAGFDFQDGKTYLITLSLEGTQFTSNSSIWFGASEARSFSLNMTTSGTLLSATQLFLEDGSGATSGNWIGFGTDIVPSFGVHLSSTPPPLAKLVISEIMYNPPEAGTDSLEYIEIYNADTVTVDLDGYTFDDGVNHTFTSGDTIGAGQFRVIAVDTTALRNVFGYSTAFKWSSGGLSNSGEDITLVDAFNRTVDSVDYDDASIWLNPNSIGNPDGDGPSIELIDLNTDNNIGTNWMASLESTNYFVNTKEVKGSPGYFPIQLELSAINVSCNGNTDGTAKVIASRGFPTYTYLWSNGMTADSISNLAAATYTITVTDNSGRTKVDSITITEPAALVASINLDSNVSCNGFADGGATASATGGTGAYTYLWSNGATTAAITGVTAASYSVTVTDANGCTNTSSVSISEPSPMVVNETIVNASCNGVADGSISINTSGGTSPYTYLWSNGATTSIASQLAAASYTVTITDANGCSSISSSVITEPAAITNTVTQAGINLTADQNGATYQWLDCNNGNAIITGETAQTFVATANGSYAVEITLNNCVDTSACANVISVGLESLNNHEIQLHIFPNPTKGLLNINVSGTTFQNERMRIFDLSGKIVREMNLMGNQTQVDLQDLNSGIYFVQIGNERRKIILTH